MKAALLYSNDDGFSLAVEFLNTTVKKRIPAGRLQHQVWYQPPIEDIAGDYLGHYNRFLAKLFQFRPDVLGFSAYVWNFDEFLRMSEMVRRFLPECKILWGGAQANSQRMAGMLLRKYSHIDFVMRGESENSYPAFLDCMISDGDISQTLGLSWRKGDEIVHNPPAPQVNLADIPEVFTAENLPLRPYLEKKRPPTLAYETGRGCRQHCKFCLYGIPTLRAFPMDRVASELRYLLQGQVPLLRICDAHFGISRKRSMELFEIISAYNSNTIVDIYPDTKHVDKEYVQAMNRAGCRIVSLGIQSSDPGTLAVSARRFDEATFANAAGLIRDNHNRKLSGDIILGLPGDNYQKVKASIEFAYRNGIEKVHFAPLMAFPGVDFFENSEDYSIEHFEFAPPLVVQSNTFTVGDYQKSMVLASYVEKLQEELPTLLKALICIHHSAPISFAEGMAAIDIDLESPLSRQEALRAYISASFTGTDDIDLLVDSIEWDAMIYKQRHSTPRNLANLFDRSTKIKAIETENILNLRFPAHKLDKSWCVRREQMTRGEWSYLFPPGGAAIYLLDDSLKTVLDEVQPEMALNDWVTKVTSSPGVLAGETGRVQDLIRILYLSEVVKVDNHRAAAARGPN